MEDLNIIIPDVLVICQICFKKFDMINNSHLKNKHNITPEEYKCLFPNFLLC